MCLVLQPYEGFECRTVDSEGLIFCGVRQLIQGCFQLEDKYVRAL